jgi:hypothetical protein
MAGCCPQFRNKGVSIGLISQSDIWGKHLRSRLQLSDNTHAFWHACLRHFVLRTQNGQSLGNLTIVVTQRQQQRGKIAGTL